MTSLAMPMDASLPPSPASIARRLILRLALNAAAAALGALLFALVRLANVSIQPWALSLATAAGQGLLSGLYARVSLRDHSLALRFLVGLASTALALIVLGWMTWGLGGITPGRSPANSPDWLGLIQLGLGALAVALAQESWRQGRGREPARDVPSASGVTAPPPARRAATVPPDARDRAPNRPRRGPALFATIGAAWRRLWGSDRVKVRLGHVAENRCPYCLDPISRRDPRGIVVCPICHTPHHADCWAVTGMCQVPHHNR